jgi:hypothetical protein
MRVLACQSSVSVQRIRKNGIKDIVARRLCGNLRVAPLCLLWSQRDEGNSVQHHPAYSRTRAMVNCGHTHMLAFETLSCQPPIIANMSPWRAHQGCSEERLVFQPRHAACLPQCHGQGKRGKLGEPLPRGQVITSTTTHQFKVLWASERGHHVKRPTNETWKNELLSSAREI